MRKSKRRQTNLISLIIVLVTVACIVALVIALVHQASLEMRFDAIINFLKKIEKAVAGLSTHMEILVCIFALWLAKTQLPLPVSVLSIIAGMVFPLSTALIINLLCSLMFFVIKYEEENRNVTYSYTDILTRAVEVDVFDGNGYSPLLPPITETKKQRNLA